MEARLSRRRGWALALAATFTMSISYVDRQTFAILAPTITMALAISEVQFGWLGSAFALAYLVGAPLSGRLVDRVGARRALVVAVLVWSIVAALHSVAMGFVSLVLLRIALGLAESPSFPGAAQTVHRALPPDERPRGFGVLFTGSSIGAMLAAPLASRLEGAFGWRPATVVTAIFGLIWIPIWIAVAFGRKSREVLDRREPAVAEVRVSPWAILGHRAVVRAIVLVIASAPFINLVLNWGAKLLAREHHVAQSHMGDYLWLPPILFDIGAVVFGDLATRHARKTNGAPAKKLVFVAMLLATTVAAIPFATGPWGVAGSAAIAMAGGGALYALLTADMLARVPPDAVSTAGGITAAAQSIAQIVVNPLIGAAVERFGSYAVPSVALAIWVVPGTLYWILSAAPAVHEERVVALAAMPSHAHRGGDCP